MWKGRERKQESVEIGKRIERGGGVAQTSITSPVFPFGLSLTNDNCMGSTDERLCGVIRERVSFRSA